MVLISWALSKRMGTWLGWSVRNLWDLARMCLSLDWADPYQEQLVSHPHNSGKLLKSSTSKSVANKYSGRMSKKLKLLDAGVPSYSRQSQSEGDACCEKTHPVGISLAPEDWALKGDSSVPNEGQRQSL